MITNNDMDDVFHALAHATRRAILDRLRARPGQGVGELAQGFDVSRIAIMNHLSVLEKAGLVISEKNGRKRCLFINTVPIQLVRDRWINAIDTPFVERVAGLKHAAEAAAKLKREGRGHE